MAQYDEEMNKRREKREAMRRRQQAEQRRLRIGLAAAAVVLVLGAVGLFAIIRKGQEGKPVTEKETAAQTTAPTATEPQSSAKPSTTTTIHIKAAGDLNITNAVVDSGMSVAGYDYTNAFLDVAPILADADLTVLNFEGNVCGEPYGTETSSAPAAILDALRNAGVDMVQTANSRSVQNGLIGMSATLQAIRKADLVPLGSYASNQEFQKSKGYTICNVQGVKVAFVAFTKGVGGMGLPEGNEKCVNLLYTDYATTYDTVDKDGIRAVLKNAAAEKPDITVAMLHWGSEFNEAIGDAQKKIVDLMKKEGVDVVIGTHPHLVQKVEFDQAAGTLVAYSLGDFYGDGNRGGTNYSIILDVEITKDLTNGSTRVTDFSYVPIYTRAEDESPSGKRQVVRIEEALLAYAGEYVDKVTNSAQENMMFALDRIDARVNGKDEPKDKK